MSKGFQRSFQGRMAARDRESTRQTHRDRAMDRNTRMGPSGSVVDAPMPGTATMGNVTISNPETRFNPEMAANQRAREALAINKDAFGHQQGMDTLDRRIKIGEINMPRTVTRIDPDTGEKYTEEIPGANLNQEGYSRPTLEDVMGFPGQDQSRANVWNESGQSLYETARQGLGTNTQAGNQQPPNLLPGQIPTDSGPGLPGRALKPYPQQAFFPRIFQGASQGTFGQSLLDREYTQHPHATSIEKARKQMLTGKY